MITCGCVNNNHESSGVHYALLSQKDKWSHWSLDLFFGGYSLKPSGSQLTNLPSSV